MGYMYFVYILRNNFDNSYYTGFTKGIFKRQKEHKKGTTFTTKKGVIKAEITAPAAARSAGFLEKFSRLICRNAELEVAKAPAKSDDPIV